MMDNDDLLYTSSDDVFTIDMDDVDVDLTLSGYTTSIDMTLSTGMYGQFDMLGVKDEKLRKNYPELQHAWDEYQALLEKYRVWDHVATDQSEDDEDMLLF
jgi:hypothetical protein